MELQEGAEFYSFAEFQNVLDDFELKYQLSLKRTTKSLKKFTSNRVTQNLILTQKYQESLRFKQIGLKCKGIKKRTGERCPFYLYVVAHPRALVIKTFHNEHNHRTEETNPATEGEPVEVEPIQDMKDLKNSIEKMKNRLHIHLKDTSFEGMESKLKGLDLLLKCWDSNLCNDVIEILSSRLHDTTHQSPSQILSPSIQCSNEIILQVVDTSTPAEIEPLELADPNRELSVQDNNISISSPSAEISLLHILTPLSHQSHKDFDVIITEEGLLKDSETLTAFPRAIKRKLSFTPADIKRRRIQGNYDDILDD